MSGPRYTLSSDEVIWSMTIGSGQSCTRGFRFNTVIIEDLQLISAPQNGQVTLHGPGFSYKANPDFHGEDSFTVTVLGSQRKLRGMSMIRVVISVVRGFSD